MYLPWPTLWIRLWDLNLGGLFLVTVFDQKVV